VLPSQIDVRIKILEEYLASLREFENVRLQFERFDRHDDPRKRVRLQQRLTELQSVINRTTEAASAAAEQSGTGTSLTIQAPAMIGGRVSVVDLFQNVFGSIYEQRIFPHTIQCVERAIGAYEAMRLDPSLNTSGAATASLDLVNAITRALRPSFKTGAPSNEREVQDAIEVILRAIGADYSRDKDVAVVGNTSFKPDFAINGDDLALEVKLANEKHSATAVQHELTEDVAGYKTKWKRLIAVIYDCGAIHDPEQMREANERHFGVTVLIVKH
jgi:hypothetical protein